MGRFIYVHVGWSSVAKRGKDCLPEDRVGVEEPRPASHDNTNIGAARTASRKGRKLLAGMKSAGRALVMCTKVSTLGPTVTW